MGAQERHGISHDPRKDAETRVSRVPMSTQHLHPPQVTAAPPEPAPSGQFGWWLTAAFVIASASVLAACALSSSPAASLIAPAIALLTGVAACPHGTWTVTDTTVADAIARVVALAALAAAWAGALGAASVGWTQVSCAVPLFFGWVAVMAIASPELRQMRSVTFVLVTIAALLAGTAIIVLPSGEVGLTSAWLSLVGVGLASGAFASGLIAGGAVLVLSALIRLGRMLRWIDSTAQMRSLGVTFAGLCATALTCTVLVSTPALAPQSPRPGLPVGELVPVLTGATAAAVLLVLGAVLARGTASSWLGAMLSALGLASLAGGGWLTGAGQPRAVVSALLLVLLAAAFALFTGLAWTAVLVRNSDRIKARLARRPAPARRAPAVTAPVPHGDGPLAGASIPAGQAAT